MFKRVSILGHPLRPAASALCDAVAEYLAARNVQTWCNSSGNVELARSLIAESDLVIAIGGDGSMLRAARLCAAHNVPVFGINAGHLGFLTEASAAEWQLFLDKLLNGDHWIEERMMIHTEAWRGERLIAHGEALNDAVISRGAVAKSILLDAYIDGGWTTQYNADGLIIATPTGSTAYALAVGGPILPPTLKNILVVPVAPHLTLDRPIVLAEGATIEVLVAERTSTEVTLTLDGESLCSLLPNDCVIVSASAHVSRFVRLRERNYFYRSLLDRMEPRLSPRREGVSPRRSALEKKA